MKNLLISLFTLACVTAIAQPQINTVVGNGFYGQLPYVGIPATQAECYPIAVTVNDSLDVFYIDAMTNTINKVNHTTGVMSVIGGYITNSTNVGYAGDGGLATTAIFNGPQAIAADDSGNVYIADKLNFRVRKIFAKNGIIQTYAGTGVNGFSGDGAAATSAKLGTAYGLCLDDSSNLYITDQQNVRIRKVFKTSGVITTIAGNGSTGYTGDTGVATSATFNQPCGIAADDSGNIYIADRNNNVIRKVTKANGKIVTIAGNHTAGFSGNGGSALSAQLNLPVDVAVDDSANIFIADQYNNAIRKVKKTTGNIFSAAGTGVPANDGDTGLPTKAALLSPYSVSAKNPSGKVWICVYGYRIRAFNHY